MIRTLLLAAFVAVVLCQEPVDQSEWYGWRMGQGPFCDSDCLPHGDWQLRRDWATLESANEDKFLWYADGVEAFWDSGCGGAVNGLIYDTGSEDDESDLLNCKPGIIYFFEYIVDYNHEIGRMIETLALQGSFKPTDNAWAEFISDYFDVTDGRRTDPWNLIRMVPSTSGASRTTAYDNKVVFQQTFVANYERNFCTFVGSTLPIRDLTICDFNDDFDSDFDSDEEHFVTHWFCEYLVGVYPTADFFPGVCGDSDEDACDRLRVLYDNRRQARLLPAAQLRETMLNVRANGRVEQTTRRDAQNRGQYEYEHQPIPGFGPYGFDTDPLFWSDDWDDAVFYYVPYTSSITAPYCGFRD